MISPKGSNAVATFPKFWRFAWMFFMQPVSLNRILRAHNVEPGLSLPALWRQERQNPACRQYLRYSVWMMLGLVPAWSLGLQLLTRVINGDWKYMGHDSISVAWGVVVGVSCGLALSWVANTATGLAFGVAWGATWGLVGLPGVFYSGGFVCWTLATGLAFGVSMVTARGVGLGVFWSVIWSVIWGVILGVSMALYYCVIFRAEEDGVASSIKMGIDLGIDTGVAGLIALTRLPIWIVEVVIGSFLRAWGAGLKHATVLFHELSAIPLPYLRKDLLSAAFAPYPDFPLIRRVLATCEIAPGQRRTARCARAELWAYELRRLAERGHWKTAGELGGEWLPGAEAAESTLLFFSNVARHVAGAQLAGSVFHRCQLLDQALAGLADRNWPPLPSNRTTVYEEFRVIHFPLLVSAWKDLIGQMQASATADARLLLPNPFIAGNCLRPEENGNDLLRGREATFLHLQRILANPRGGDSVVILAPRRVGKSSLLRMLPVRLPDVVSVFFDLQDNPCNTPASFLIALDLEIQASLKKDRRIHLPRLGTPPDIEAAAAWFGALDDAAGALRILLCIDEFERLEELWSHNHRRELLQLMGLFRATIQHRRRLRILVSGVTPLAELGTFWLDHFVNAQMLRLDYLSEADVVGLLQCAVPAFAAEAIPL